jgi:hypothetical protein
MTERMTENTKKQPAIDMNKVKKKLLQQKEKIAHLEKEAQELREEIANNQAEQHRVTTKAQLAIDESALAKSLSQKNYAPLLLTLFEKPSKQIRNTAIIVLLVSILSAMAAGYFSAGYLSYTHNIIVDKKISVLQEKIDQSLLLQQQLKKLNSRLVAAININSSSKDAVATTTKIQKPTITKSTVTTEKTREIIKKTDKQKRVEQQVKAILRHVKSAEKQDVFPDNYTNDKTQFAQLYLLVMQHTSNETIYYESYLKAIKELGIADSIAPKTTANLIQIDTEFLHAAYSGWAITTKKKTNGWRYREEDRRLSSFYDGKLQYDLGTWQLANESKNYKTLPDIFALNMERIKKQLTFNDKSFKIELPKYIYYLAYAEENKNKAIEKLFSQKNIKESHGKLKINASKLDSPLVQKN